MWLKQEASYRNKEKTVTYHLILNTDQPNETQFLRYDYKNEPNRTLTQGKVISWTERVGLCHRNTAKYYIQNTIGFDLVQKDNTNYQQE